MCTLPLLLVSRTRNCARLLIVAISVLKAAVRSQLNWSSKVQLHDKNVCDVIIMHVISGDAQSHEPTDAETKAVLGSAKRSLHVQLYQCLSYTLFNHSIVWFLDIAVPSRAGDNKMIVLWCECSWTTVWNRGYVRISHTIFMGIERKFFNAFSFIIVYAEGNGYVK